jgi:hypothetical protein
MQHTGASTRHTSYFIDLWDRNLERHSNFSHYVAVVALVLVARHSVSLAYWIDTRMQSKTAMIDPKFDGQDRWVQALKWNPENYKFKLLLTVNCF